MSIIQEIVKVAKEADVYQITIPHHDDNLLYMLDLALRKNDFLTVSLITFIPKDMKIIFDWASKIDHILYYYLAFYCIKYKKSKCYEYVLDYHISSNEELNNIYDYAERFVTKKYDCNITVNPTSTLIKIKRLVEMLKIIPIFKGFVLPCVTFRNKKTIFDIYYNDEGTYLLESCKFKKSNLNLF